MEIKKYSVLMSVYKKEDSHYLEQSLRSVLCQTIKPDEVILVKDGPLTEALESVIDNFLLEYDDTLSVYALKENKGLGYALNYGLEQCNNEIIFRMDTDDIAIKERAEIQLKYLEKNPNVSVLGSYIEEFIDEKESSLNIKKVPQSDSDIKLMFKKRNAMNHPSVVFKKSDVLKVGGYIELKLNEDYFLWVRMAENGCEFANINQSLVKMRVTEETYQRRGGFRYFLVQNSIYKYMKDKKYISFYEYLSGFIVRSVFRVIVPNEVRKLVYKKILRKGIE